MFDWPCLEPFRGTCLWLGNPTSLLCSRSKRVSRTTRPRWVARIHGSPRHPIRWSRLPCDQAQSNNRWSTVSSWDQNSLQWVLFALRARQWKGPRTGLRWDIYRFMIHPTWICWGPWWWRAVFSSGPVVQGAMKTLLMKRGLSPISLHPCQMSHQFNSYCVTKWEAQKI